MAFNASFLFHGSLQDFLHLKGKRPAEIYAFKSTTSIKDAIEAIGVPHVEVSKVLVNDKEKDLAYLLQPDDKIEVFPFKNYFSEQTVTSFVLDVHLGKLASLLRMLGIDAVYENNFTDKEIVAISAKEKRPVLTRDIGLLKHKVLQHGYWLRSQQPEEQAVEVINYFSLCTAIHPFSRCLHCNGELITVDKEEIIHLLPTQTKEVFTEFYQCTQCKKVYWKGSHFERMQSLVEKLKSIAC